MKTGKRSPARLMLFGGIFDPPHLGHREAVEGLLQVEGCQEIWIIPSGQPAQKQSRTAPEHRLEMARLNFANIPRTRIWEGEIHRNGPSYSYETLMEIRREAPSTLQITNCIGMDQWLKLSTWHRFPEILKLCHWLVFKRRNPENNSSVQVGLEQWQRWKTEGLIKDDQVLMQDTAARALSSTEIRAEAARGKINENHLKTEVFEYLMTHVLYGRPITDEQQSAATRQKGRSQ